MVRITECTVARLPALAAMEMIQGYRSYEQRAEHGFARFFHPSYTLGGYLQTRLRSCSPQARERAIQNQLTSALAVEVKTEHVVSSRIIVFENSAVIVRRNSSRKRNEGGNRYSRDYAPSHHFTWALFIHSRTSRTSRTL